MPQTITRNQWYTVIDGETMPQIAQRAGFRNWLTIYNHDRNLDFRYDNPDPYYLETGGQVWIPEKVLKEVTLTIGQEHRFIAETLADRSDLSPEIDVDEVFSMDGQTGESFDLRYEVPLIPQQEELSAWAAGVAMLLAWRDEIAVDLLEVTHAMGYWAQYRSILQLETSALFRTLGIETQPVKAYTVEEFEQLLLAAHGPLWVASSNPEPNSRIRVVTGITGDGTPQGTVVYINDTWEAGMTAFRTSNAGAQYTETYQEFLQKQMAIAPRRSNSPEIFVAYFPDLDDIRNELEDSELQALA